ncbi:MAG: class I SAM-dependent methyltransferase [Neisseriaceae bacterium]|nr:class I SAM-dependent methyltransferase [Neisseriaceae bacterium]
MIESRYIEYVSHKFGIPISYQQPETSFFLVWEDQRVALQSSQYKKPIVVNFESDQLLYRTKHNQGELIVKAINLKKYNQIWDATAGLGKDSFLLASFGAEVTLFERNPIIAALLWDGIQRARNNKSIVDIMQRIHFIYGSILDDDLTLPKLPEVIYLDPMFPERRKSAQVKKEMTFLQKVVGEDSDYGTLFARARALNIPRIVVKRSKLAPAIDNISANFSVKGQSTRFDIYLNHH